MKKLILYIILSLMLCYTASAQNITITHGPYLCDMTQDGVTVVWTTNKPAVSWVELAPDGNESFYAAEHPKIFDTKDGRKLADRTTHRVRLSNLMPGTGYRYRIFSQEVLEINKNNNLLYGKTVASNVYKKKPFQFLTYPDSETDVSFLVMNDIHGRIEFMRNLCKDIDFKKFNFISLNGDMSNSVESEEQIFADYIDTCVNMFASEVPIMYNRGNHETRGAFADYLSDYFPTRDGRFYQLYSVGTVCFLVLDGGEDKPDSDIEYGGLADYDTYRQQEAQWLSRIVETKAFKEAKARIVFLHIPPPVGDWHGNAELRRLFMPILNNAHIDLMFSGHTHRYSFLEAGNKSNFPIIVNDNSSYVKCSIDANIIKVELVDEGGTNVRKHEFRLRK